MDGMEHGSRGSIADHAAWSAAPRLARAVRTVLAPSVDVARSTDTAEYRDAITVRQLPDALPSFAVTPTLYFHDNTSAAVALTVGVESVAIDPHKAATDVQSLF